MVEHLTSQSFKQKIFDYDVHTEWKHDGFLPSVIDFWAPWCGPCRIVGPIIDELAAEYRGRVHFYKVNTDEEQELAAAFDLQSIPSLLFVPQRDETIMIAGTYTKDELKKIIDEKLVATETDLIGERTET